MRTDAADVTDLMDMVGGCWVAVLLALDVLLLLSTIYGRVAVASCLG